MEIRDPIHGSIKIDDDYVAILENPFFKRLRGIKQLGLSEYIFPGGTHTRFIHSLGVMTICQKILSKLLGPLEGADQKRIFHTTSLAALLHDVGHAPLSHATESVMPMVSTLKLPKVLVSQDDRQATHEDYTVKAIIDSNLTQDLENLVKKYGVDTLEVARLVIGKNQNPNYFTIDGKNYFPLLHQIISSEMDCDRMDYLLRDSYFCGVSYGRYDLDWIIDNLDACPIDGSYYLGISERALSTFDDFLLSRYHMFLMVYFHYRSVCLEQIMIKYFKATQEYRIPSKIDEYEKHDDHFLMEVLRSSKNEYAQMLVQNKIPDKIFESFHKEQLPALNQLISYLKAENIEYIHSSSQGRLSKYYSEFDQTDSPSIQVVRKIGTSSPKQYLNIHEATQLYKRYQDTHLVNRVHVWVEKLSKQQFSDIQKIINN